MAQLKNCRICDSSDLIEIMDFGNQPWCNDFFESKPSWKGKILSISVNIL